MPKRWDVTADNPELFAALISSSDCRLERTLEQTRWKQLDVFGEIAEHAAREEARHALRLVATRLEGGRELGKLSGNLPRHDLRAPHRLYARRSCAPAQTPSAAVAH